jgi:hypothetical protein
MPAASTTPLVHELDKKQSLSKSSQWSHALRLATLKALHTPPLNIPANATVATHFKTAVPSLLMARRNVTWFAMATNWNIVVNQIV